MDVILLFVHDTWHLELFAWNYLFMTHDTCKLGFLLNAQAPISILENTQFTLNLTLVRHIENQICFDDVKILQRIS